METPPFRSISDQFKVPVSTDINNSVGWNQIFFWPSIRFPKPLHSYGAAPEIRGAQGSEDFLRGIFLM